MSESSFEPVLLDLGDADDYYVLTAALDDFASHLDAQAEEEARTPGAPGDAAQSRSFRILAARARRMRGAVERQLQANAEARRAMLDT
ncbi:MAG: hypothetical protein J0J04_04925 [Microbacterium sp.]|uniref:hypothetical protein n=1 Tax=Microbacterium sp. TaxID=51671 RepID=UPI001AC31D32|nr:hypothetical protein [Microbacterium sp.]MBN9214151.1 hypothetical protein [Microbacterium sp.]